MNDVPDTVFIGLNAYDKSVYITLEILNSPPHARRLPCGSGSFSSAVNVNVAVNGICPIQNSTEVPGSWLARNPGMGRSKNISCNSSNVRTLVLFVIYLTSFLPSTFSPFSFFAISIRNLTTTHRSYLQLSLLRWHIPNS